MITRTIITTEVSLMTVNTVTAEVETHCVSLPVYLSDENKILKKIKKDNLLPENVKAVEVLSFKRKETLYGMDENAFIKNAEKLDPSTRKPLDHKE